MTLFFETERQSLVFLTFCLLGFVSAVLLDVTRRLLGDSLKPLGDVLLFLLCGGLFTAALLATRSDAIRLYQWLAFILGAILYLCGVRRLMCLCVRKTRGLLENHKKKSERSQKPEGNARNMSKSTNNHGI